MLRDACAVSEGGEACLVRTVAVRGEPRGAAAGLAQPAHLHRAATGTISTCGARGAFAFAVSDAPSSGAHFAVDNGEKVVSWRRALRKGGFCGAFF